MARKPKTWADEIPPDPDAMRDDLIRRAGDLMDECKVMGFDGVFLMANYDTLDDNTHRIAVRRGNYYTCIGLLHDYASELAISSTPVKIAEE